jgi:hypothetical protein
MHFEGHKKSDEDSVFDLETEARFGRQPYGAF